MTRGPRDSTLKYMLLFLLGFITVSLAAPPATLNDVKENLKITEGRFEKSNGDSPLCGDDRLALRYEKDGNNIILRLGEKQIFANLALSGFNEKSSDGCDDRTETKTGAGSIYQVIRHACVKNKNSYAVQRSLELKGEKLHFSYERRNQAKELISHAECFYTRAKPL